MRESVENLRVRLDTFLHGAYDENIDSVWNSLYFCAAKKDGEFNSLFLLIIDFLKDERLEKVEGIAGLFIHIDAEIRCFSEDERDLLVNAMAGAFPHLDENAQFSLSELWGTIASRAAIEAIRNIVPNSSGARNYLAHALGHIQKNTIDEGIAEMARNALGAIGGNPNNW
jgi:hypothetical protein